MSRDEMLSVLHNIPVKVSLTVLTSECALECQYMTRNGTRYEWIGMDEWPLYIKRENGSAVSKYYISLDGKEYSFDDYKTFEDFFLKKWIGEVKPWEEFDDATLEEWIKTVKDCEGIPFREADEVE